MARQPKMRWIWIVGALAIAIDPTMGRADDIAAQEISVEESLPTAEDPKRIFPQDRWLKIGGWFNAGAIYNANRPSSGFNGPAIAQFRDEWQFNQLYLTAERELPKDGFGLALRVDVLFGMDHFLTQARGLETRPDGAAHWNGNYYGTALPQAFAAFGNSATNLRVGHFYSIIGYEQVPADGNFFYTRSYSHCFHEPFTVTGVMASHQWNDAWTIQGALHNGADAFDPAVDRVSFMGGVQFAPKDAGWKFNFALTTGDEPSATPPVFANSTKYFAALDVNLSDDIEIVLQHDLGTQSDGKAGGGMALWYSVAGYSYYKLSDKLKLGTRLEWFRDEDGIRVGSSGLPGNPNIGSFPGSFFEASLGVNYAANPNLRFRPELRWDWFDGTANPFNDGASKNQLTIGFDVIMKF